MNFNKFINSDYLKSNPLCGISTYKDTLNLATGVCMRQIKKLVLTGEESGYGNYNNSASGVGMTLVISDMLNNSRTNGVCSHFLPQNSPYESEIDGITFGANSQTLTITFSAATVSQYNLSDLTSKINYIKSQYAAGTPVTVWYVLANEITETVTVPTSLSGTEEGYLNQSGTPTPTNPIYPTANTVEQWFDINHYIMGTSTDTITTLPADIYLNDTTATVGLKGQTVLSGTPTLDNPIMPEGTGERTNNWFDWNWLVDGYHISQQTGLPDANPRRTGTTQSIDVSTVIRLYLSYARVGNENVKAMYSVLTNDDTLVRRVTNIGSGELLDVSGGTKLYIAFYDSLSSSTTVTKDNVSGVMLNTGSTALPYEPYGYKLPFVSGDTTTPIYLGEVPTTRQVKKYVFDGTEDWHITSGIFYLDSINPDYMRAAGEVTHMCSHFPASKQVSSAAYVETNTIAFGSSIYSQRMYCTYTGISTVPDFKAYLAQQYANGTPVTVWYVLATPQTAVVNEPLMKIGDYADSISNVSIPTIAGTNTLSVDTTVQPSEVTANYHGWHPVQSVHEAENGQWD